MIIATERDWDLIRQEIEQEKEDREIEGIKISIERAEKAGDFEKARRLTVRLLEDY